MVKKNSESRGDFTAAIELGAVLRPMIESAVRKLTPESRNSLRKSLIQAERHLSDRKLSVKERFDRIHSTFEAQSKFGPTWKVLTSRIEEEYEESTKAHDQAQLRSVSVLFGLILESLANTQRTEAA